MAVWGWISIHSPHTRGDNITRRSRRSASFQSTPLIRGETAMRKISVSGAKFQSTPLIRGETTSGANRDATQQISIHSPHTRGDRVFSPFLAFFALISIHSPHTRGDQVAKPVHSSAKISIHSPHTRGDLRSSRRGLSGRDFNPLPSYEGRPLAWSRRLRSAWYFNPLPSYEGRRPSARL